MMRQFYIIFALILLTACDDGDVINVQLEFDQDLELCTISEDSFLIYDTKEDPSESLALLIPRSFGEEIPFTEPNIPDVNNPTYSINESTVRFIYREYNRTLSSNDLCETIPPGDLTILEDSESSDGNVYVTVIVEDDDEDGIPSDLEGRGDMDENGNYPDAIDTDLDGIPNYQDEDDDGDNVPTILEIDTLDEDGDDDPTTNPLDTDNDGEPDYLDMDDDGDMIDTINEDSSGEQNPRDMANEVADAEGNDTYRYLYSEASDINEPNEQRLENQYTRTIIANFLITNFNLDNISATELDFGTLTYEIEVESPIED